jgi:Viral BACON domain
VDRETLGLRCRCWTTTFVTTFAVLFHVYGCGASSTTVLQPSNDRCQIGLPQSSSTIPADGGAGSIAVSAARECLWTATSESQWITITSGGSGQGDGTVNYRAVSNPAPAMRRGALVINSQRAEIAQAAAPCLFRLGSAAQTFPATGGEGSVAVEALDGCSWTAASGTAWIAITALQDTGGPGTARFRVEPNTGDPRTGSLTIADLSFSIVQAGANTQCTYGIEPTAQPVPAAGGNGTIAVSAPGGCPWTAVSQVPWIAVATGSNGTGNGIVNISIDANTGSARTGLVTIASQLFTVTQAGAAAPCSFAIAPASQSSPAAGGTGTVTVTAASGCPWTSVSQVPWITVTAGASGSGNGTVTLAIGANTGAARTGTVAIAGQTYSVSQAAAATPCSYGVAPTTISAPPTGGPATVTVTTESSCSWTAVSQMPWITVTNGASGAGNGTVSLTVAANGGAARTGSVIVGGVTVTVNQAAPPVPCTYTIAPTEQPVAATGGTATVAVTTQTGCGWNAASQISWITITRGASGTGAGTVGLTVAANDGPARMASITIAGNAYTVSQAAAPVPCTYTIAPTEQAVAATGGPSTVAVTTQSGCAWSAVSNVPWMTVASGASGAGSGTVELSVAQNTGVARSGTASIAGHTFTVAQAAAPTACTYSLTPVAQTVTNTGGEFTVQITTQAGCPWTAVPGAEWIQIVGAPSGSGPAALPYRVLANSGAPRTRKIDIATERLTVVQGVM